MLYFQIRESQSIDAGSLIVILNGKIATLVKERDRIVKSCIYVCQERGIRLLRSDAGDIIVGPFHHFN